MKSRIWIPFAISVVAAYVILNRRCVRDIADYDELDSVANRTSDWGTDQRIRGTGKSLLGKMKEGLGRFTGNPDLVDEGVGDQIVGGVKDAAGRAAHVATDVIRDLDA